MYRSVGYYENHRSHHLNDVEEKQDAVRVEDTNQMQHNTGSSSNEIPQDTIESPIESNIQKV